MRRGGAPHRNPLAPVGEPIPAILAGQRRIRRPQRLRISRTQTPPQTDQIHGGENGSIVGTAITEAARQARTPPPRRRRYSAAMNVTARLPVRGSNRSFTNDQKAEITDAPKSAVCR